eukprot:COSAG04_NODE_1531_length_6449_cov_3.075276_1_plen_186_part_00
MREKDRYDTAETYCGGEFDAQTDQINWNTEGNHLSESMLAQNWIQTVALLAKTVSSNETRNWTDVLSPLPPSATLVAPDLVPAGSFSQMVDAFLDYFHFAVLPFATSSQSVPNQRSTGILGLMWIGEAFATTRKGALIKSAIDAALQQLLHDMVEPDGGMLEQSWNYHKPVLMIFKLRGAPTLLS